MWLCPSKNPIVTFLPLVTEGAEDPAPPPHPTVNGATRGPHLEECEVPHTQIVHLAAACCGVKQPSSSEP